MKMLSSGSAGAFPVNESLVPMPFTIHNEGDLSVNVVKYEEKERMVIMIFYIMIYCVPAPTLPDLAAHSCSY